MVDNIILYFPQQHFAKWLASASEVQKFIRNKEIEIKYILLMHKNVLTFNPWVLQVLTPMMNQFFLVKKSKLQRIVSGIDKVIEFQGLFKTTTTNSRPFQDCMNHGLHCNNYYSTGPSLKAGCRLISPAVKDLATGSNIVHWETTFWQG